MKGVTGLSDLAAWLTTGAGEFTPAIRSAYLERIKDFRAKSYLAYAARKLHRTPAPQHVHTFMTLNRVIYGEPDRATYLGLVAESRLTFSGLSLAGRTASLSRLAPVKDW